MRTKVALGGPRVGILETALHIDFFPVRIYFNIRTLQKKILIRSALFHKEVVMKCVSSLVCALLAWGASAQTSTAPLNAEESAVVRSLLDSAGNKDVTVESVTQIDPEGRITSLDLHNQDVNKPGIAALTADIGKLTHLQTLLLGNNSLTSLPEEIGNLTALKFMDLKYNSFTELPAVIGKLSQLERLDARFNQLSSFPYEFFKLTKLNWLQLWGNQFKMLPEDIVKLVSLRELYMNRNKLIDFPKGIMKMKSLKYIDFQDNQLCNVSPEVAAWLKKKDEQWKAKQTCN